MARLFWVGTGVALTIIVMVKGRQVVRHYAPAALVDRAAAEAQATGVVVSDAASHFMTDFRTARDERAATLASALLASTQGTVEDLKARRDAPRPRDGETSGVATPGIPRAWALDDVDPDEEYLGYSF